MNELALIAPESADNLGQRVDQILSDWYGGSTSGFRCDARGLPAVKGKGMIGASVRGRDLYILADVCNSSMTYRMERSTECHRMITTRI